MTQTQFSGPAHIVVTTLRDHPHLNTAQAIDGGPYGIEQIDAQEIADAITELAAMDPPRVAPRPGGGWTLVNPREGE